MTAPVKWYGLASKALANAEVDFDTHTIKCMLATSSYTPNQDTHDYVNDVTNETSGTGYTAGGIALTSKTVTYDTATNTTTYDCADITAATLSVSARWAIFYRDSGTPSTSALLWYADLTNGAGGDVTVTSIGVPSGIATDTVS
jgi:hypothetical protein